MEKFDFKEYAKLLKDWVAFSQKHLYYCPEKQGLICYGVGEHGTWAVQTQQKAFSAFAILAALKEIDLSDFVLTREQLLEQALGMLRYSLHTHLEGDFTCSNGKKWGHSWIYALGIERMFHAIDAIEEYLTDEDRELLKKVMISESDFILNHYPIEAGLVEHNKPESNIWNGSILYRTAFLYPDSPNRDGYIEKARRFFANGLSVESDENSDEVVDGIRIGDVFVGANMFDSYACNHHGYLNIGYMNICLSNIAMLHFFFKSRNIKGDDMIYHHLYEQWQLIRETTFDDGRLLRIGGDSRARYCYCQDYALPAWALIEDVYHEDCSMLEDGWLKILQTETSANGDGSFLSKRFGYFENLSPLYYTRLESDRANAISMAVYWHNKYDLSCYGKRKHIPQWKDEYHGSALISTGNRYASFTWEASEKPQGLILPKNDSSFAEWRYNLAARICGVGRENYDEVESKKVVEFNGGFLTFGTTISYSDNFMAEGQSKEKIARKNIVFTALPDENTVLCLQYAKTLNRVYCSEIAGTFWNIPNDVFNNRQRKFKYENGEICLEGGDYSKEYETISLGKYANVDDKIGIASKLPLTLVRRGKRQVEIRNVEKSGTLYCEEICAPYSKEYKWIDKNTEIINTGFAVCLGDCNETKKLYDSLASKDLNDLCTIGVLAKDNNFYTLVANFTETEKMFDANDLKLGIATDVVTGKRIEHVIIKSGEAILLSN